MSQLGPVTSLKFITHNNFFYQGEREGEMEGGREGKGREERKELFLVYRRENKCSGRKSV